MKRQSSRRIPCVSNLRFATAYQAFFLLVCVLVGVAFPRQTHAENKLAFNADVRSILSNKCFACHGFDEKNRQADLRLDTFEGATTAVGERAAIVPGKIEESELWRRITSDDEDEVMPPPESHQPLSDQERAVLRRWIEEGAEYQQHWSFEPIKQVTVPSVASVDGHPLDRFIAAGLERHGLSLANEADKETLLRRVAFALSGLPPTPPQRSEFLADQTEGAYERMVDRYLSSPHYGEEMARHWLDVARYADTHGMHLDNERQMWAYRDWVINAFNRNQPFDEFTIEQLAGDLLPSPTIDQLIATGFNRCNVTTSEGGSINDELLYRYAVDRASTTFQAWLGLTGGCAVCHDHKFDPLSAKDFYSFYAFFNSAADPGFDGNALLTQPAIKLESEEARQKLAMLAEQLVAVQAEIDQAAATIEYIDPATLENQPTDTAIEFVWLDDSFPESGVTNASPGAPTMFVTGEPNEGSDQGEPVLRGSKSLKRTDAGLAQDYWDKAKEPLMLPVDAKIFAHVWLDPKNLPKSIMVQFHRTGWEHRAVWGDYNAIDWGAAGTTQRVHMGELPEAGKWVKLELPPATVGLAAGDALTGFALTQFGGTVYWDYVGVSGTSDPARDPKRSFKAWWQTFTGKDNAGVPDALRGIAKLGPEGGVSEEHVEQVKRLRTHYLQEVCVDTKPTFAPQLSKREELRKQQKATEDAIPGTFVFRDMPKPRESFVMLRGAYDKPGDPVQPNVPAFLPSMKRDDAPEGRATRLDLARWLVNGENPLTARVTVNRLWQQFFGVGLVKTSYDFGSQGDMPSNPELLDWLALDFQQSGWDVRAMVRQIVCSRTFRQESRISPALVELDPENRLLARGPRFRLDAEQIRDNALFVSGLLDMTMGGKGVKTYQPDNIWEPVGFAGSNTRFYKRDEGSALYRRSIYSFFKRTAPPPFMVNFDAPNREQACVMRERSNTPLQALQLMNDVQHVEAARSLAQRMLVEGGQDLEERIKFAFLIVLGREPVEREREVAARQWQLHLDRYRADTEAAKKLVSMGESKANPDLDVAELASATLVMNMLLNLDETLTRN